MSAPPELMELMRRYNQLGRLLPVGDAALVVALADAGERADLQLVLAEMNKVKGEIDRFLANGMASSRSQG